MKSSKYEIIEGFDTVKFFRKVKTRLSKKLYGMTYEQLRAHYDSVPDIVGRNSRDASADR
jgi:hypothetical protein